MARNPSHRSKSDTSLQNGRSERIEHACIVDNEKADVTYTVAEIQESLLANAAFARIMNAFSAGPGEVGSA